MKSDDLTPLREALRDLVRAGYRIDLDDKEVLRVWFRALQRNTLDDIRAAVDKLLTDHDTATIRPKDVNAAIRDVRRERQKVEVKKTETAEPETTGERLRRLGLPWTVEQYETHESRLGHAMLLRIRGRSEDAIVAWLRERKDIDQTTGKATPVDVPDKLLTTEEKTVASWFRS